MVKWSTHFGLLFVFSIFLKNKQGHLVLLQQEEVFTMFQRRQQYTTFLIKYAPETGQFHVLDDFEEIVSYQAATGATCNLSPWFLRWLDLWHRAVPLCLLLVSTVQAIVDSSLLANSRSQHLAMASLFPSSTQVKDCSFLALHWPEEEKWEGSSDWQLWRPIVTSFSLLHCQSSKYREKLIHF